jgi:hypothetical protein
MIHCKPTHPLGYVGSNFNTHCQATFFVLAFYMFWGKWKVDLENARSPSKEDELKGHRSFERKLHVQGSFLLHSQPKRGSSV